MAEEKKIRSLAVSDTVRNERRQEVASKIAEQMRNGNAVWQQKMDYAENKDFVLPHNIVNQSKFTGYNMIEIFAHKGEEKIGPTQFFTFKQASTEGWRIKKGAKAIPIERHIKMDMGYKKDTASGESKFYKEKTDKPILYNEPVFSVNDLQGEHEFSTINNISEINISKFLENAGIAVIKEKGLQKAFYSITRDEIHTPTIEDDDKKGKKEYCSAILKNVVRAAGAPNRAFTKGIEGFADKLGSLSKLKNKFITELATMQLAMRTGLSYEPSLSELENRQIAGLIEKGPYNLVAMANQSAKIVTYVMVNSKKIEKNKGTISNKSLAEEKLAAEKETKKCIVSKRKPKKAKQVNAGAR